MTVKDFSPLNGGTGTIYSLNLSTFKGTELFFTDSNDYLYLCVMRREYSYSNVANIIEKVKLEGYYNGTDYDYRIDCKNYISIIHSDLTLTAESASVYSTTQINPKCELYLALDSTEFYTGGTFYSYIYTKTNYDEYLLVSDLASATSGLDSYISYIFNDCSIFGSKKIKYPDYIYDNTYLVVNLDETQLVSISAVTFYDGNDVPLITYDVSVVGTDSGVTSVFYLVPGSSAKCIIQSEYETASSTTIYSGNEYIRNQYFYFGTSRPIDSIEFSGKRNRNDNITRKNIYFGKRKKSINIDINKKYIQNTGLNITELKLFDLFKSPIMFDFSGTTIDEWLIDELTAEGNNTKTFEGRNVVLNLTNKVVGKRYTSIDNSYYT